MQNCPGSWRLWDPVSPRASRCGEHAHALTARTCGHLCRSGDRSGSGFRWPQAAAARVTARVAVIQKPTSDRQQRRQWGTVASAPELASSENVLRRLKATTWHDRTVENSICSLSSVVLKNISILEYLTMPACRMLLTTSWCPWLLGIASHARMPFFQAIKFMLHLLRFRSHITNLFALIVSSGPS